MLAGTVELTNVTGAYNEAASGGAFAYSSVPVAREVRTVNTIVSNNTEPNCAEPLTSLGHNLEDAHTCGFTAPGDLTTANPLLLPLGDYRGVDPDPRPAYRQLPGGRHRPDQSSHRCGRRVSSAVDQRGKPRPVDGNDDGVPGCDIGAYEAPEGFVCGCYPTPGPTPAPTATPGPIALPRTGGRP